MHTILIIDDDLSFRTLLMHYLQAGGYTVEAAADGQEGLELFRRHPIDLVLVDIFMPQKDGIETIMELRALSPGVKILAVSGGGEMGGMEYLSYARVLGADNSLAKPFTRDQLLEAVKALLV